MATLRVGICACELSGDHLGASLIESMRKVTPNIEFVGIVGPKMLDAGCDVIAHIDQLSVMGLAEVLGKLPSLWQLQRKIIRYFLKHPPDIFIGIDGPDFNFPIEKKLKCSGISVAHYVSPSVWAWRQYRIRKICRSVDLMLTLFPFETTVYEEHGIPVKYTGHPLLTNQNESSASEARTRLGLDESYRWVALLPGSRKGEVSRLLPLFLHVARHCKRKDPLLKFVIPVASTLDTRLIEQVVSAAAVDNDILFVSGTQAQLAMSASDVALVASGTATFECLLAGTPMVVAYKMNPMTYQIVKRMMTVDSVSLPNHLGHEGLVPEFIQAEATPENISNALMLLLSDKQAANRQKNAFTHIVAELKNAEHMTDASNAIFNLIETSKRNNAELNC